MPQSLLEISPQDFTLPAGGIQGVSIQVNLAGVTPGVYQGAVVIRSDNAGPHIVPLTLEVQFHQAYLPAVLSDY